MKKAKRFLALTLTAAMALGMLAGCGGSGGDETTAPQTSAVETGGAGARHRASGKGRNQHRHLGRRRRPGES